MLKTREARIEFIMGVKNKLYGVNYTRVEILVMVRVVIGIGVV